jgi:uncharacterized DUF497 family protein
MKHQGSSANKKIEWDERKSRLNRRKHGVTFEEAATVFSDPLEITIDDPDHSSSEHRFISVGTASNGLLLVVAYTERGDAIRLISSRKPTRRERKMYEEE